MKNRTNVVVISLLTCWWAATMFMVYRDTHKLTQSAPENCTVDLVVFSFDRPMQLYAFLESATHYLHDLGTISVIYRATNDRYKNAYQTVQTSFDHVAFIEQGANPRQDFKPLLMTTLERTPSKYIAFAVDDIIVKKEADLAACIKWLEQTGAFGFYLRLGTHLDYCYTRALAQPLPQLTQIADNVYTWTFKDAVFDWAQATTVDMAILRKKDIVDTWQAMAFTNPNTLEASWDRASYRLKERTGLCFADSVIINIPLNLVQDTYSSRHMHQWDKEELLAKFEQGLKIDLAPLHHFKNNSAHYEFPLNLVERTAKTATA